MKLTFLVVDDRELDCFVAKKLVEHTGKAVAIYTFSEAEGALDYISTNPIANNDDELNIVLLDIMMPLMNGFEFMDRFEKFDVVTKSKYHIIALTTSLNQNDLTRIKTYKSIKGLIRKPISLADLAEQLKDIEPDFLVA